jgi:ABC-2 type transport system permease protein
MIRALRLAWSYLRINAANEVQYRANFVIQLINSAVALATGLVAISLVYSHTTELGGWRQPELLVVMGIHIVLGGIIGSVVEPNMQQLMREVEDGNFDLVLTRPADSQLMVSMREFRFWRLLDVLIGTVVIVIGARGLGVTASRAIWFLLTAVMGMIVMYCVWLILATFAFRVVRADAFTDVFAGVYQAGRWPVSIYPAWLRAGLTYLIPLAFAVTVPAETLTARRGATFLLVALVVTVAVLVLTRWVWTANLKRYSGASA